MLLPAVLPAKRLDLGPTFDGSALCPADTDLIHDGSLVNIKTHLATMDTKTGFRTDSLALTDLYQILSTGCSTTRTPVRCTHWASPRHATAR